MNIAIAILITAAIVGPLGFVVGSLVYRKNQARIESVKDAATK